MRLRISCFLLILFENIFMVTHFFTHIAMCVIYLCKNKWFMFIRNNLHSKITQSF
jgi:hypothetical protein